LQSSCKVQQRKWRKHFKHQVAGKWNSPLMTWMIFDIWQSSLVWMTKRACFRKWSNS
jgi:hypothetical protein